MKSLMILLTLVIMGCSIGPLHITHVDGELPKAHVDTGYENCKVRNKSRDLYYRCMWTLEEINEWMMRM